MTRVCFVLPKKSKYVTFQHVSGNGDMIIFFLDWLIPFICVKTSAYGRQNCSQSEVLPSNFSRIGMKLSKHIFKMSIIGWAFGFIPRYLYSFIHMHVCTTQQVGK